MATNAEKNYMHMGLGMVDTQPNWESQMSKHETIDGLVKSGYLIEVVKDDNGNWVEPKQAA